MKLKSLWWNTLDLYQNTVKVSTTSCEGAHRRESLGWRPNTSWRLLCTRGLNCCLFTKNSAAPSWHFSLLFLHRGMFCRDTNQAPELFIANQNSRQFKAYNFGDLQYSLREQPILAKKKSALSYDNEYMVCYSNKTDVLIMIWQWLPLYGTLFWFSYQ